MDGLKAAMSLFYVKGEIRNIMVFPYCVLFVESTSEWPSLYPAEAEGWIIWKDLVSGPIQKPKPNVEIFFDSYPFADLILFLLIHFWYKHVKF